MKRIAIVGAGISGLTAAYCLGRAGQSYHLYEASARAGGILQTHSQRGFLLELGADSFLSEKSWARDFCRELGLESQLIGSNDSIRQTFVLINGKLMPLPGGLQFIVPVSPAAQNSGFFSDETRRCFASERGLQPRTSNDDESVSSFIERHFGGEVVARLAAPMLAGVYGGTPATLSAHAVLPRFVDLERSHGSLLRAFENRPAPAATQPIFITLRLGMQQLADTLINCLSPDSLHLSTRIEAISRQDRCWHLRAANRKPEAFDALLLALPAHAAGALMQGPVPTLADKLAGIRYTSSLAVSLAYEGDAGAKALARIPSGFGFLVPRGENVRMMACTFVHNKFPHRVPAGSALLRAFFGGSADESVLALADNELLLLAQTELHSILGLNASPAFTHIQRWPHSMPQYEVGHLGLVKEIETLTRESPGLFLAGNAYHGVGVPDCIRSGRQAAEAACKKT